MPTIPSYRRPIVGADEPARC